MAEHGAHLTSGGVSETSKPSIFEVLAQENLLSTIRPAVRHAVRIFSERHPEHLGRLFRHFDEIFLAFDAVVQSYYLNKYGGSFSENFYDLKRVPSGCPDQPLLSKHRLMSLACLILIPYVRHKLDSYYEALRYREELTTNRSFLQQNLTMKQRLIKLYLSTYPYVHSLWECLTLAYTLSYMLGKNQWHSPSMHLSGTELRRLDPQDELTGKTQLHHPPWSELSFTARMLHLAKISLNTAAVCLSTSLSVGMFFLQFLDWWYASDSSATSLTALPVPPPPQKQPLKNVSHTFCPLCLRLRTNSTALAVSGYVFCYLCISEHVQKEKCCPFTGHPATVEHLIRIYEQDV
ncbi:hypothetical protein BsWGS_21447 [Bradybaena similaris]